MRFRRRVIIAAAAVGLVVSACAGGADTGGNVAAPTPTASRQPGSPTSGESDAGGVTGTPSTTPTSTPTAPEATAPPNERLAFTAPTVAGGTFDGASLRGDVVVWFWAPW